MSFDHRANDGAYCSAFLAKVKQIVQTRDWSTEVAGIVPQPARTTTPAALTARAEPTAPTTPVEFPRRRGARGLPPARASPAPSTTARSRSSSRTARSSRSPAPATRRCCSASPATCGRATTGSSPTTATGRSCSALGVTPIEMLLQAVGVGGRPRVGRPPDAVPLGLARAQHRQPDVVHRQPVPARGRVRRGGALHQPPPAPARLHRARRRGHLRVARRGRDVGRRVLGVRSTPRAACTSRCSSSSPTTATRSRCARPTRRPAPISEMVRGFRGLHVVQDRRPRLLRGAAQGRRRDRARPRRRRTVPRSTPRSPGPTRTRSSDDPEQVPRRRRARRRGARTTRSCVLEQRARRRRACSPPTRPRPMRAEATRDRAPTAARQALAAARPDPATVTRPRRTRCPIPIADADRASPTAPATPVALRRGDPAHAARADGARRAHPRVRRRRRRRRPET